MNEDMKGCTTEEFRLMRRCSSLAAKASFLYRQVENATLSCPAFSACPSGWDLWSIMFHLNDTHQWTREQIADWLDTLPLDLTLVHPDPDRA